MAAKLKFWVVHLGSRKNRWGKSGSKSIEKFFAGPGTALQATFCQERYQPWYSTWFSHCDPSEAMAKGVFYTPFCMTAEPPPWACGATIAARQPSWDGRRKRKSCGLCIWTVVVLEHIQHLKTIIESRVSTPQPDAPKAEVVTAEPPHVESAAKDDKGNKGEPVQNLFTGKFVNTLPEMVAMSKKEKDRLLLVVLCIWTVGLGQPSKHQTFCCLWSHLWKEVPSPVNRWMICQFACFTCYMFHPTRNICGFRVVLIRYISLRFLKLMIYIYIYRLYPSM